MFDKVLASRPATIALNVISGTMMVLAVAWFVNTMLGARDVDLPPRIVNSITLSPTILLAGKPFTANVNVTLNKLCPYEVQWSLVREGDGVEVVKIIEPVRQPPDKVGTFDLPPVTRYVPSSVEPGEYKYFSVAYDMCADGHTYTSPRKGIPLSIR